MNRSSENSGGPVAIRGYLVQTIVALLDIAQADPPFTTITLEPAHSQNQFDFVWSDGQSTHAVQVKSSVNKFSNLDVKNWAAKMEANRRTEHCRLMLVGKCHSEIIYPRKIGTVTISSRPLDLDALFKDAAYLVARFVHAQRLDAGMPEQHIMIVEVLIARLLRHSVTREPIAHAEFVGFLRQWIEETPKPQRQIDISNIDCYAPAELIGREKESQLLVDAWERTMRGETQRPHVLTFVASGGEGKTALVAKWAAEMAHQHWIGCEGAFAWSFYSQASGDQMAASSDLFLRQALIFFGDTELADSPQSAYDKGKRLAQLIGERRTVLILDGLEPLQYSPASPIPGQLKDHGIAVLLKGLAANSHGLCVVTTRYSVPDLRNYESKTALEIPLLRLTSSAGVHLLKSLGVFGKSKEFHSLVENVKGHALALNLLGTYLRDAHGGDIRKWDLVNLEEADIEEQGGHAFRVMDAYVLWFYQEEGNRGLKAVSLLNIIGLFDRPIEARCLSAILQEPVIPRLTEAVASIYEPELHLVLRRLETANLISLKCNTSGGIVSVDSHPLVREYFGSHLKSRHPEAWRSGHERVYFHLISTTIDLELLTLENLQPLFQAVIHGCSAGRYVETRKSVLCDRIQQDDAYVSTKRLGAWGLELGALSQFFEKKWSMVVNELPDYERGLVLSQTQLCLRSLGRFTEALAPLSVAMSIRFKAEDWYNAAICSFNTGALQICLGAIREAIESCILSDKCADQSKDIVLRIYAKSMLADAFHRAGELSKSREHFLLAEELQITREGQPPILITLPGFCYSDLLSEQINNEAWRLMMLPTCSVDKFDRTALLDIENRATKGLQHIQSTSQNPLHIAFSLLTLSRVEMYRAIALKSAPFFEQIPNTSECNSTSTHYHNAWVHMKSAILYLRLAGMEEYIPLGLLFRAWLRCLAGSFNGPGSAQEDLDEAWEIAAREPMPLYLADIHLYRSRLFFSQTFYPWTSPQHDLDEARRLIDTHGYWQRKEELETAYVAILSNDA